MTATLPARRIDTDAWVLRTLREAKEYRDSIGEPDAYWDARLAETEAACAGRRLTTSQVPDAAPAPRGTSSGASSYGGSRNAPSEAQVRYLSKLAADLGTELDTPRDRDHASRIIDAAKKALAARPVTARPARPATPGQVTYLADLLATRVHTYTGVDPEALTFAAASALIDALSAAPRAAAARPAHGISEGRYAYAPDGAAAVFYRVGRTGRITVQAGPAEHPYRGQLNEALLWIKANQRDAAALYGRLLGSCGMCGRELTDETSRALGLGPVCASK